MRQIELHDILYEAGKGNALALRAEAKELDGTVIISREQDVPRFVEGKDYSQWPVGAPVADDGQVWQLIQPYNGGEHPEHPKDIRAHWGLCHTRNPADAKSWVDAFGTSGLYYEGECYRAEDGTVYRCLVEETNFDAAAMPDYWEAVQ